MKLVVCVAFMVVVATAAITLATGTAAKNISVTVLVPVPINDAKTQAPGGKIISRPKNSTNTVAIGATTLMKLSTEVKSKNKNTVIKSLSQKLLDSQHDLRDFVTNQMNEIYEILKLLPDSTADWKKMVEMDVDRIPAIEDTLYVGNFKKKEKFIDVQYSNVEVFGMSDFKNYVLWVDQNREKTEATLMANELKIVGNYSLSNFLRHPAYGSFTLKLLDNVTYTEKDRFCKYENEVDIAAGEATVTYYRSEYEYRNADAASIPTEDVISAKLIHETLYRVGRTLAHKIRHVIISKISRISSHKGVISTSSNAAGCNRIASIVQSIVSQIRTWLKKSGKIWVPLPKGYHKMKIHPNTIVISNITLNGLNTMYLREQIQAYKKENNFYVEMDSRAGPLIIGGVVMMTELRNGTFEQIPTHFDYEASRVDAKIVVSSSLSDEKDSLQVDDLNVSISQPNLSIQPGEIEFKPEDLAQLAEILKPDVESDLHKWLKDFINDTFRRTK